MPSNTVTIKTEDGQLIEIPGTLVSQKKSEKFFQMKVRKVPTREVIMRATGQPAIINVSEFNPDLHIDPAEEVPGLTPKELPNERIEPSPFEEEPGPPPAGVPVTEDDDDDEGVDDPQHIHDAKAVDVIAAVADEDSIEKLEQALAEENDTSDGKGPRKTVVSAIEKRIADLKAAQE